LRRLYGGLLGFHDGAVVANFVETLDGVVTIPGVPRANAVVSGESEADRFVVGLLRACARVVLVGAGTLRASPGGAWQGASIYPDAADAFAELRQRRGLAPRADVAIVTSGRSLDPAHPVLEAGALVLTTEHAAAGLRTALPGAAEVVAVNDGEAVDLARATAHVRDRGGGMILSEAGPTVFGQMVDARLVDELFLTLSPLVAGRSISARPSLAEGVELLPERRDEATLLSVRRDESHLFLRYALH